MPVATRILIVEDSLADAGLAQREIRRSLELCEFQQVDTRPAYLQALETFRPDLIVTDYTMPQFDGMTALKLALQHVPQTPVIVWTGSINEDTAVQCMKAGANNYVLKDNIKRLGPAVLHALEEKKIVLQRQQAEASLRASEARFSTIFHASPIAIAIIRLKDDQYLDVNPAWEALTGYSHAEVVGHTPQELNIWVDFDARQRLLKTLRQQGAVRGHEIQIRQKSGQIGDLLLSAELIEIAGEPCMLSMGLDVTERVHAEEALRRSEERFRTLYERMPLGYQSLDFDGHFIDVNQAWLDLLGYERDEVIGHWFGDFLVTNHKGLFQQRFPRFRELGEVHDVEFEMLRKDGSHSYVSFDGRIGYNQHMQFKQTHCILTDITHRKLAEEALKQSEAAFRELADSITDVFFAMDQDLRYTYWNKASEALAGISAHDALGKSLIEVFPDTPQNHHAAGVYRNVMATQQPNVFITENVVEGNPCFFEISVYPSRRGLSVFMKDITERKRSQAQLEKALAEKETLLRELYHRTKNNMSVISALLDLQSSYVDDPRVQDAFGETQNRIRSMALVHQKLYEAQDLSRVNLKEYINDLAALLLSSYRVSSGRLNFVTDLEDIFVLIDTAIPCGLILNELFSNALKYAFPAGRAGEIRVQLHCLESGEIRLRVADDGVGVAPGFDVRKDGHLGLQTVFTLVENQLRGQILFETQSGVDCEIRFRDDAYLPRV